MDFLEFFLKDNFFFRTLVVGFFIALASSQIGIFLVARKMSLIGDSLSHASLGALSLGLFWGLSPYLVAFLLITILAIGMFGINHNVRFYSDTFLGVISVTGIASAVLLNDLSDSPVFDLHYFLFGNIHLVSLKEMGSTILGSLLVLGLMKLFYHELFRLTLDKNFALTKGLKYNLVSSVFIALVVFSVLLTIQLIGALLVSALLILPAATALQLSKNFFQVRFISGVIGVASITIGILSSYWLDLPTGALVVLINGLIFSLAIMMKKKAYKNE